MKSKTAPAPARQKTGTAFFSITGEFITDHARDLWQEGQYAKAFDTLGCLIGATREHHEAILFGKSKLIGVNNLDLVPDDWTPPAGYATLQQALTRGTNWPELERRREDEAWEKLNAAASLIVRGDTGDDASEARMLKQSAIALVGPERAETVFNQCLTEIQNEERRLHRRVGSNDFVSPLDAVVHATRQRMALAGFDPDSVPTADALLNRGMDLLPEECTDMSRTAGWLLPTGKYYGCGAFEHIGLATTILEKQYPGKGSEPGGYERLAEKLGWLKISGAGVVQGNKATQKQLDKLHMYAEHHKLDFKNVTKYFSD